MIEIKIPKGYMNCGVSTDNTFIADTNDSQNWDTLSFPLPTPPNGGVWSIHSYDGLTVKLVENMDINPNEDYSPYCPICGGCGEEGCCPPTMCKQHPDGDYCETYLRDLKFGYVLNDWFHNKLLETLPQEVQDQYLQKWDELYDVFYKNEE